MYEPLWVLAGIFKSSAFPLPPSVARRNSQPLECRGKLAPFRSVAGQAIGAGTEYEDVDHVMEVIKQVDEELRQDEAYGKDILEPLEIMGLDQFADSAVIIKARNKTKPLRQWAVGCEFNRRLKKRFDELHIEIPYPHLTLYAGQGKDGTAAPHRVDSTRSPSDQKKAKE